VQEHYDELNKAEALQAEARKLALDTNNKEMITLLNDYNPKWKDAGQSFGKSLLDGLNSEKESIKSTISDIMSQVDQVGGFSAGAIQGQMEANSATWDKTTDQNEQEKLHQKNVDLAKQIPGSVYNKDGTWDIPGFATGTNMVKNDGLAMLHQGEAVVPKKYNPENGGARVRQ